MASPASKSAPAPLSVTTFAPNARPEAAAALLAQPTAAAKPKIAVFVAHGMGQQVPFETMDAVAQGLAAAVKRKGQPVSAMRAQTVNPAGFKTQRIEIDMRDASGRDVEVHLYEGYWAPFTEGEVTIRDVMSFLMRGGINGIRNAFSNFLRWVFGRPVDFGIRRGTAFSLLIAFGVVVSLIVFNALLATVAVDRIFKGGVQYDFAANVFGVDFAAVTTIVGTLVTAALTVMLLLFALMLTKRWMRGEPGMLWRAAATLTAVLVYAWMGAMIFGTIVLLPLLAAGCIRPEAFTCDFFVEYWPWLWGGLLLISAGVRTLLIQYMGDVAAYVSTHTVDRFNTLRAKIKTTVLTALRAIYAVHEYERVSVVGHSLGSVVVYDALNTLLTEDHLSPSPGFDVANRTRLLLTFGSPLDKTAFIFATQWANTTEIREALAASFQPLVLDYAAFRGIKWVNIHAPRDVISGALDFYDDKANPQSKGRTVVNMEDRNANIPFVAHVEYWRNTLLFDQMYANL